jgi:gamma-glutamyltranspeptidase/glutathione hydrolase
MSQAVERPARAGWLVLALLLVLGVACTRLHDAHLPGPPVRRLNAVEAQSIHGMVSTATVESTWAAVRVLEEGGNAVDAAAAASLALGVVDPGDSGIGGAVYMVVRLANGQAAAIDGSAVVPFAVDRERLIELAEQRQERGIELAAVPGALAALDHAVRRYGTLPLAKLLAPAIELAESGSAPNAFQRTTIRSYLQDVLESDYLRFLVLEDGRQVPSGDRPICRPELALTLRAIASLGAEEFYRGSMAELIADDMEHRGGFVRRADLAILKARELRPVRGTYRNVEVLSFPYPGSGAAVVHALDILENFDPGFLSVSTVDRQQVVAEAFHIAIEDYHRATFLGNPSARGILPDKELAAARAALIKPGRALDADELADDGTILGLEGNTTQVSVVDRWGNAVSLTQTLGRFFGSKAATPGLGFPYNNLLEGELRLRARSPIPTAMAPTMVLEGGEVMLVLGSAGSSRIPGVIASVISNVVDRGMDLGAAVAAPRVLWGTGDQPGLYIEIFPPISVRQADELDRRGYDPVFRAHLPTPMSRLARFGAVNAVSLDRSSRVATGVGDPRRLGSARGPTL